MIYPLYKAHNDRLMSSIRPVAAFFMQYKANCDNLVFNIRLIPLTTGIDAHVRCLICNIKPWLTLLIHKTKIRCAVFYPM